jgi:acetyl esterase/lipase
MPLDPRAKRFLDLLAASNPPDALTTTVAQRRKALAEIMKLSGAQLTVGKVEDRLIPSPSGELRIRLYAPPEATDSMPALIYFHGGGLVAGSLDTHDSIARALTISGLIRVISVDYRLAPEHPFPAALEDAMTALRYVSANPAQFGIDVERLGICGDSAGATLATATCQAARAGGLKLALQLLICPILDYTTITASRRELASGYLIDEATLNHDLRYYLPAGSDAADPRISPLRAQDLAGLPRTSIHTAEFDPLRDEGQIYFERLSRARTEVSYTCHPGMIHLFYGLGAVIPYARTAFEKIGGEIRAALS